VIVHSGASPVFVDVHDGDLNIDPERVTEAVTGRTKAIIPVHLAGQPADLDPLWALGTPVVEDAAHALESAYRGRKLGGLSTATCFSLYATKNLAAGEGGLVATNDDALAAQLGDLRLMRRSDGSLYDIAVPGYKANLSDVLAAIALVQLDKLGRHRAIRARQVAAYDDAVAGLPGIEPLRRDPRDTHAYHLYVVRIDPEQAGGTRDEYASLLADENIATSIHFLPVHTLSAYRERLHPAPRPAAAPAGGAGGAPPLPPALAGPFRRGHRGRRRRAAPSPGAADGMNRSVKVGLTLLVTVLCTAYVRGAVAIMVVTTWPMALRWKWLLDAERIHDRLGWLTRAYFVSYAAGQVLPTAIGGDAPRRFHDAARHLRETRP